MSKRGGFRDERFRGCAGSSSGLAVEASACGACCVDAQAVRRSAPVIFFCHDYSPSIAAQTWTARYDVAR